MLQDSNMICKVDQVSNAVSKCRAGSSAGVSSAGLGQVQECPSAGLGQM